MSEKSVNLYSKWINLKELELNNINRKSWVNWATKRLNVIHRIQIDWFIHPVRCVFFVGVSKLTINILKLQDIEDKKKWLARFMQIKCRDCDFKHSFYTLPQIDSTKDNRRRGMKTMEINVRALYGFRSIGVSHVWLL